MNKLAFEKVKKSFLEKNPTGSIWKEKDIINVTFAENEKVYNYKVNNHIELINRLKLDIKLIYKADYDYYIKQIEKNENELKQGYYIDDLFNDNEKIEYNEAEINSKKYDIECYKAKIENATII